MIDLEFIAVNIFLILLFFTISQVQYILYIFERCNFKPSNSRLRQQFRVAQLTIST